jgi:hypothetical protein
VQMLCQLDYGRTRTFVWLARLMKALRYDSGRRCAFVLVFADLFWVHRYL